jgi:hypothetical protein
MKNFINKKTSLFVLFFLLFISTITVNAQVAINNSGASPNASSMLDIVSANKGVLIPRVSYSSISSLTVQGLLVYVTSGGPNGNGFYFYESGWKKLAGGTGILGVTAGGTGTSTQFTPGSVVFAGVSGIYSQDNANFFWNNTSNWLGLGIHPNSNFHIYENNTNIIPASLIEQDGTGDAAMQYYLTGGQSITTGINNSDNDNFKISNTTTLTGTTYGDGNTMMRIHTEGGSQGITDLNHQSRGRLCLLILQAIPIGIWTKVDFDNKNYDEHTEFTLAPPPGNATFTAKEEGYYQVNSRTEFDTEYVEQTVPWGYVSIAIFVTDITGTTNMYAQGNNLQITDGFNHLLPRNNAPNVSDVVYLQIGETIEIFVFQNFANPTANILPNTEITYVSVHKIS